MVDVHKIQKWSVAAHVLHTFEIEVITSDKIHRTAMTKFPLKAGGGCSARPLLKKVKDGSIASSVIVIWSNYIQQWVRSIREVTEIFNEHGIRVSHSKVYHIQAQRDDLEAGRPITRAIRPLPKWTQFRAVGKRGERNIQ